MALAAVLAAAQMGKMGYDMYNQRQTQEEQETKTEVLVDMVLFKR